MVATTNQVGQGLAAALTASSPAGGWCRVLGKAPGSPVTADDVGKIRLFMFNVLSNDPNYRLLLTNPLTSALATVKMSDTLNAIRVGLQPWVAGGRPCDTIPNNLNQLPEVDATLPDNPVDVFTQGGQWILDVTGLGAAGVRLLFLAGIVVLIIIALKGLLK